VLPDLRGVRRCLALAALACLSAAAGAAHAWASGPVNSAAFGVFSNGSAVRVHARCRAGSAHIALGSPGDFADRQGVSLPFCGPPPVAATPRAPLIAAVCTGRPCPRQRLWNYRIAALDRAHGLSAAGPTGVAVRNAAILDVEHHNLLTWPAVAGAASYVIYRAADGGDARLLTYSQMPQYDDFGQPAVRAGGAIPSLAASAPSNGNLVSYILAGAGTTAITLADGAASSITQTWMDHDDAPIVQRAVDSLATGSRTAAAGGTIWLPPGRYAWGSPVTVTDASGVLIRGAGTWATALGATPDLAGMAAFRFVNSRESGLRSMWIDGAPQEGAIAGAALEFREDHPKIVSATHDRASHLMIGNPRSGGSIVNGVVFSCSNDANNENADLRAITVQDFSGCGVLIGHSNSEGHAFDHLDIGYGPCGIQAWSGGFRDMAGFYAIDGYPHGVIYDYEPGTMYHSAASIGVFAESSAQLLRASPELKNLFFSIIGLDYAGGVAGGENLIDLSSTSSTLAITASWIQTGQPRTAIYSADAANVIQLIGNSGLGLSAVEAGGGSITSIGNHWLQNPVFDGSRRLFRAGDLPPAH
jgi:hypothetical protein